LHADPGPVLFVQPQVVLGDVVPRAPRDVLAVGGRLGAVGAEPEAAERQRERGEQHRREHEREQQQPGEGEHDDEQVAPGTAGRGHSARSSPSLPPGSGPASSPAWPASARLKSYTFQASPTWIVVTAYSCTTSRRPL